MSTAQDTLRVRIPIAQRSRNGRPRIQPPADYIPETDNGTDPHVLRNFAQAWSWRRRLESGEVDTIEDIARSAGVTHRMVGRMLKLTYLAPALLEKLLLERVPPTVPVKELAIVADMDWPAQARVLITG
ncbi:hypothetical protein ACQKOE_16065 [Novosphingobium sp. NPDC080210]|uniref:hypothetical protein n=1 Tax=Novosphingobium sp. NPDC080210 TaxID=3390596 RepID=UPI003CFD26D6